SSGISPRSTEARRHGGSGVARGWGKIARSRRWSLALRCAAMNEAPIFRFNSQRQRLVESTIDRSVETIRDPLIVLNDAAFHETRRLDKTKRPKDVARLEAWRSLARSVGRMSDSERRQKLREIATEYAEDIAGNF